MKLVTAMVLWCVFNGSVAQQPHKIKTYKDQSQCQRARVNYEQHNVGRSVRCSCIKKLGADEQYKPAWAVKENYR